MKKLSLIIVLVLVIVAGFAQTYPVFDFTATYTFGADGNVTSFDYNGTEYSGITMGPMVKFGVTNESSTDNFMASNWPTNDWSQSGYYIGFTISAVQGYKFTVNTITFGIGRDANGTRYAEWRGSGTNNNYGIADVLTNYTTLADGINHDAGGTSAGRLENPDTAGSWTGNVLTVGNSATYQNVTTNRGFRMYLSGTKASAGIAGLDGPLTITGTYTFTGTHPVIEYSPKSITGLDYEFGQGPSQPQIVTVSGAGFEANKSILVDAAMSSFAVATVSTGPYEATANLFSDATGYVEPTPVYVHMDKDLAVGTYSGTMHLSYNLPVDHTVYKTIPLSGEVTDGTLPVELSHFSATMTAQNYVQLTWVTQTETNLMGYNVYRNDSDDLSSAAKISELIAGTNTSSAQTYVYYDMELDQDGTYYYWLQNVDMDGTMGYHGPASVFFTVGGNGGAPAIPKFTRLENAYPNPFNPDTTIRYQLNNAGHVKIDIYNIKGQIVRSFERNHADAGHYGLVWDGCDSSGKTLPSGVYHYRMTCGRYSETKKMVLQK